MPDFIELINEERATSLGKRIGVAKTFRQRFVGLLGRSKLEPEEGLLIVRCNQVHMYFMRMPLGLIFLSPTFEIVELVSEIRPWQFSKRVESAYYVLELPVGVIESANCNLGDRLISKKV
jgi:uncharacterized membrane protein (UPF0127 family)